MYSGHRKLQFFEPALREVFILTTFEFPNRSTTMKNLSFNNKKFVLVQNSKTGKVNSETLFFYKQERDLVTADYQGGTVRYGKIIALLENDKLDMLYQCVTDEGQLKAGKALATVSFTESQKIRLKLNWEWITGEISRGNSEYIEI